MFNGASSIYSVYRLANGLAIAEQIAVYFLSSRLWLCGLYSLAGIRKAGQLGQWKAFAVGLESDGLSVDKLIQNIGLIYDTEEGLADFVRCFHSTWQAYEAFSSDHTKAIEQALKLVVFSSDEERVDPEKTGAAVTYRNADQTCEIRFHSVPFAVGHDRFRENIIAHELRHVWQFATNYEQSAELRRNVQRLIWETDAVEFAKKLVGKESNVPGLAAFGLPCDETFDRLIDCWGYLTEEERLDVLQQASGLASERIANARKGL